MAQKKRVAVKKSPLFGDEGMWLLNQIPRSRIRSRYGVLLDDHFGTRVMSAAVRLTNGGSASFVSSEGLIMTNHHVAHKLIASVSTAERDLVAQGFYAPRREDELKIPHAEANVLVSIEDVTERVLKAKASERKKVIAALELESKQKTGLRSDVVELYQGGAYHLYCYERYTDVRLVFAPEMAAASFGGDFDNYEYPRFCLDVTFLRLYDASGVPVKPRQRLTLVADAPTEESLLFVAGHPGRTDRLTTYAALMSARDHGLPYRLRSLARMEILYQQYAGRGSEYARRVEREMQTVMNLRKRYMGQRAALQDPVFMRRIEQRERAQKSLDPKPYATIERAVRTFEKHAVEYDLWESMIGYGGHYDKPSPMSSNWTTYLGIARTLVRMAAEDTKKSADRLPEFADARRESLLEALYSPAPIYSDLEEWKLADALSLLLETYGTEDATVQAILGGLSPMARARALIQRTTLGDPEVRKRIAEGGARALKTTTDPMIKLALLIDARARAVRTAVETQYKTPCDAAYARIAQLQFETFGTELYPDATFTLRLAFGTNKRHVADDTVMPPYTTIAGTYAHEVAHQAKRPWTLPLSWKRAARWGSVSQVPYNFITTHDSHGGNSGSPVFDKDFHCIGILFDGISSGQGSTFMYGEYERAVCVSSAGILALLAHVYKATGLLKELAR
ncbi:MAG: S46 family peptidase [Candidatus Pacebacteria bacterium]|nr:S46 family peptidase [Candidatus Paceibacterota bacterium]